MISQQAGCSFEHLQALRHPDIMQFTAGYCSFGFTKNVHLLVL